MPRMKTNAQNKRIFGLKAKLGLEHEDLREIAFLVSDGRVEQISKLTELEAAAIIRTLESKLPQSQQPEVSRRTINYRRQKAGVEIIVTPTHLDYMRKLWRKVEGRTDEGLESLSLKVIKHAKPRTSKECSKVIEAIKAMNSREKTFGAFKKEEAA